VYKLLAASTSLEWRRFSFAATCCRGVAQLVGHLINANFFFCSQAKGAAMPTTTNFERAADKATLIKGLNEALAYCDEVYESTTDADFNQAVTVNGFRGMNPKTTSRNWSGLPTASYVSSTGRSWTCLSCAGPRSEEVSSSSARQRPVRSANCTCGAPRHSRSSSELPCPRHEQTRGQA
jgi:DinB superfamily